MNAPTPAFAPAQLTPAMRDKIERAVERLLALLDAQNSPAEDLEQIGDLEPTFGGSELHDEMEPDEDIEPDLGWAFNGQFGNGEDLEPSLGWTTVINQTRRHPDTSADDLEQELGDREPWLGWTVSGALGGTDDREDGQDRIERPEYW